MTPAARLDACALPRRGLLLGCALVREETPGDVCTRLLTPVALPAGLLGRGVLLDLPRAERRARLDPGELVDPERLDEAAERLGVTIQAGDLLLIRTGSLAQARHRGDWTGYRRGALPGLSLACGAWLVRRQLALAAADTPRVEVTPAEIPPAGSAPLRRAVHDGAGLLMGFDFDLEALAGACAEDGDYAFLLCFAPLQHPGLHSVSPLALK